MEQPFTDDNYTIVTPRLVLTPFSEQYAEENFEAFTEEITRYQYPAPYQDIDQVYANIWMFNMERFNGDGAIFDIATPDGTFVGQTDIHGIGEETPEVGVWICKQQQQKGYATEALTALMVDFSQQIGSNAFLYSVDRRNLPSLRLLHRFTAKYVDYEELFSDDGRKLQLEKYIITL